MAYTITSFGGGETLVYVFNAMATVLSFSPQGLANTLIRLAGIIGVLWVLIVSMLKQSILPVAQWFIWFLLVLNVLLVPRATVYIRDPITYHLQLQRVDNVPMILAFLGATISEIGASLTQEIEKVFRLADYLPYHETGVVFGSRLLSESRQFKIEDPLFNQNMQRFVQQCVMYDAMIGYKYSLKELRNSDNIWELVSSNASPLLGFLYREADIENNRIVTCKIGADLLKTQWRAETDRAAKKFGRRFFPALQEAQARNVFLQNLPQSYQLLSNISASASDILQQEMMINAVQSASQHKASQLGAATNYAVSKGTLQQRYSYEIAGEMARNALPVMKNVFEAIAYGAFVFIFPLMTLPNGYQILATYLGILIWIQMWAPLYAILNLIMTITARHQGIAYVGGEGLTLSTSHGLSNLNSDMAALTGWLSFSVPAIAYMMIKGGASSFVHLANHLGSAAQSAISSSAHEVVGGNISLSNFSQGTQNMYNKSAFQTRVSPEHHSGQFSHSLADGAIQVTTANEQIFLSGSGKNVSSLKTSISASNNFSSQLTKASAKEWSLMESEGVEISKGLSNAARQMNELIGRRSHTEQGGVHYNVETGAGDNQSFSDVKKFARNLQKTFGVTAEEGLQLAVAASLSGEGVWDPSKNKKDKESVVEDAQSPFSFNIKIGASAQGNYSKEVGRNLNFSDIMDVAKEQGYTETLESLQKSHINKNYGHSVTQDAGLSHGLAATLEELKTHRDSFSLHHQKATRFNEAVNHLNSSSFDTRTDVTQDVLKFIATQPSMDGKSVIGMAAARVLLESTEGPLAEKRERYIEAFKEQRTDRLLSKIAALEQPTKEKIAQTFEGSKEILSISRKDIQTSHDKHRVEINNQAREQNIDIEKPIDSTLKADVENALHKNKGILDQTKAELVQKYTAQVQARKEAGEKNLFKKIVKSIPTHNTEDDS